MRLIVVGCLVSSIAAAQPAQAVIAPYPVEVLVRGLDASRVEELRSVSGRLLANEGVVVQPKLTMKDAVNRLKRQDCATEDDCLRQLAILANALYGAYLTIEASPKTVTVAGRLVRDDGKRVAGPAKIVEERKGNETVEAAARRALPRLFAALEVSKLPATRESSKQPEPVKPPEVTPVVVDAGVPDAGVPVMLPPPPPPPALESPLKPIGLVAAISGGALFVGGGALVLVGRGQAASVLGADGALKAGATKTDADTARSATTMQTLGAALAAAGVAAGAAGVVMMLLAPAEPAKTTMMVAPLPGGAAVMLTGELP